MNAAPSSGRYVTTFRMPISIQSPLGLQKQIDGGDEHDAASHHERIVLYESGLHPAKHPRGRAGGESDSVDRAVDDELIEQRRSVTEDDDGDVSREVDETIDDVRVKPRQSAAEHERRANDGRVVELVDVVLVRQQSINRSEPCCKTIRHGPGRIAFIESGRDED